MKFPLIIILTILFVALPFTLVTHAGHRESYKEISIACSPSCPYPNETLREIKWRFARDLARLERKLGTPIPSKYKPIEVHPYFDDKCRDIEYVHDVPIGAGGFNHELTGGKAIICLKTSPVKILKGRSGFVHELSHLYLRIHRYEWEENLFEEVLARAIESCHRNGCEKAPEKTVCDMKLEIRGDRTRFCAKHDLEISKIPALVKRLVEMKKQGPLTNPIVEEALRSL